MLAGLLLNPVVPEELRGRKHLRRRRKKKCKWWEYDCEELYEDYRKEVATKQHLGLLTMEPGLLGGQYNSLPPIKEVNIQTFRRNSKLLERMVDDLDRTRKKRREEENIISILLH